MTLHVGEQIIHPLVGLGDGIDGYCLAGTWYYLDRKYPLLFARAEKPLTCLVLDLYSTTVGVFVWSALSTRVLVPVFFAMFLDTAALSTCVITLLAFGLKNTS